MDKSESSDLYINKADSQDICDKTLVDQPSFDFSDQSQKFTSGEADWNDPDDQLLQGWNFRLTLNNSVYIPKKQQPVNLLRYVYCSLLLCQKVVSFDITARSIGSFIQIDEIDEEIKCRCKQLLVMILNRVGEPQWLENVLRVIQCRGSFSIGIGILLQHLKRKECDELIDCDDQTKEEDMMSMFRLLLESFGLVVKADGETLRVFSSAIKLFQIYQQNGKAQYQLLFDLPLQRKSKQNSVSFIIQSDNNTDNKHPSQSHQIRQNLKSLFKFSSNQDTINRVKQRYAQQTTAIQHQTEQLSKVLDKLQVTLRLDFTQQKSSCTSQTVKASAIQESTFMTKIEGASSWKMENLMRPNVSMVEGIVTQSVNSSMKFPVANSLFGGNSGLFDIKK